MNKQTDIKVYSTMTCPHCKKVKSFLTENGISFIEFDVIADANARNEMFQKSKQMGVPVITIGDQVVIGFNPEQLKEKLNLQ